MFTLTSIGFTGTQVGMTDAQKYLLRALVTWVGPTEFHYGDCIGADLEAFDIVCDAVNMCMTISHPPINQSKRAFTDADIELEPREYLERNHDIVDQSYGMIAAPSSDVEQLRSGTWATVRYAVKTRRNVILLYPNGVMAVR